MSNELTPDQTAELKSSLLRLRSTLEQLLAATRDATRPVDLDEPIGRLTRMDAIQQQGVSEANRRSHDVRLRQVNQALGAVGRETFGICRRCEEPIGYPRLKARPESPYCIDCQNEVDEKHSP